MTAKELSRAEAAYRAAFARCEQAREVRNEVVRLAVAEGWTHAEIAEATGLTRGRVGQITLGIGTDRDPRRIWGRVGDSHS